MSASTASGVRFSKSIVNSVRDASPYFPRRPSGGPHFVELAMVAQGIHGLPESLVILRRELRVSRKPHQAIEFERSGVVLDIVKHAVAHDEKTPIDPAG